MDAIGSHRSEELREWFDRLTAINWRQIVRWSHRDLCRLGIDTINLICAMGLPGTEKMDILFCLKKIDDWAERVKFFTAQMVHKFEASPERYGNSLGYFKAYCLVSILQREFGVRYNSAKIDVNVAFEPSDSFIFGIIQRNGLGTCASLPVLYTAVGHALLYPMFLIHTHGEKYGHCFIRWDDGRERFNIEATAEGFVTPSDDHYRTGKFELRAEVEKRRRFLMPSNMRHSLAGFLAERAQHCRDLFEYKQAVEAMAWAAILDPTNEGFLNSTYLLCREWMNAMNTHKPPGFPQVFITHIEGRRFPEGIPFELEVDICISETTENLLRDVKLQRNLWEPLSRGERPPRLPTEVEVGVGKDQSKNIHFVFSSTGKILGGDANV